MMSITRRRASTQVKENKMIHGRRASDPKGIITSTIL